MGLATLDAFAVRLLVLFGLGLLYMLIYEHSQWSVSGPGQWPTAVSLVPVPAIVWYSTGWLLFAGVLFVLLAAPPIGTTRASDLWMRRVTIAFVAVVIGLKVGNRLAGIGIFGLEQQLGAPLVLASAIVGALLVGLFLRRPPTTPVLIGLLLALGSVVRLALSQLAPNDPSYADNLMTIHLALERFGSGASPYGVYDFPGHVTSMAYLPWTFLSYVPGFLLGQDVRTTNVVLSFTLRVALLITLWRLPLAPTMRKGLALVVAGLYLLPRNVSNDLYAEFQMFELSLVLVFALAATGRLRLAAASFGVALGAMPIALYCAVPVLCFAIRTRPWRQVVGLAVLAIAVAAVPMLAFFALDPQAWLAAVAYDYLGIATPTSPLVEGEPFLLAWHKLPVAAFQVIEATAFLALIVLAWMRLRTIYGLVAISTASYLTMVMLSPFIMPHYFGVVLSLAVLSQAVGWAQSGLLKEADRHREHQRGDLRHNDKQHIPG